MVYTRNVHICPLTTLVSGTFFVLTWIRVFKSVGFIIQTVSEITSVI